MEYTQALQYLQSLEVFGSILGLERIQELLRRMGNPQDSLKYVHIAGTNGKGSTSMMTARVLSRAGYKTGMYISPYVIDFRERMQIDGEMIPPSELARCVAYTKAFVDEMAREGQSPTVFEVITACAFYYFAQSSCDIVVLEVGMGGRFDATNAIQAPLVSAITPISLDHTDVLGKTIGKIAFEKCGIIKHGGITVCSPNQDPDALAVIMEQAALKENRLIIGNLSAAAIDSMNLEGTSFTYHNMPLRLSMLGKHQVQNCITALGIFEALQSRGYAIPQEAIIAGIAQARCPARMELLGKEPLILLDGAHNPAGAQALADLLRELAGNRRICALTGMLADKDYEDTLSRVLPFCHSVVTTTPVNARALDASVLAKTAARYCSAVYVQAEPAKALEQALSLASGEDAVLIFGSLYLASDLRKLLLEE